MDGCVPDSSRYVPALGFTQSRDVVAPDATSVANDCTRGPWGGGLFAGSPGPPATGQVSVCGPWVGLGIVVRWLPSPPPTWPTIVREVGIAFVPDPAGNDSSFFRLISRSCPVGTVITTGDHPDPPGLSREQVALDPSTTAPQL